MDSGANASPEEDANTPSAMEKDFSVNFDDDGLLCSQEHDEQSSSNVMDKILNVNPNGSDGSSELDGPTELDSPAKLDGPADLDGSAVIIRNVDRPTEDLDGGDASRIVSPTFRSLDDEEDKKLSTFACECSYGHNKSPCSTTFSKNTFAEHRNQIFEMDSINKGAVEAYIMGQLMSGMSVKSNGLPVYRIKNSRVCYQTFCFFNAISWSKLKRLQNHFKSNGFTTRDHGNLNQVPRNPSKRFDENKRKMVEDFLKNQIMEHGIVMPGRIPYYKDYKSLRFPPELNSTTLYKKYSEALDDEDLKVSYPTFKLYWETSCPDIGISSKYSDLCGICSNGMVDLMEMAKVSDEGERDKLKKNKCKDIISHIDQVAVARKDYKTRVALAKEDSSEEQLLLSFDFAQGKIK